MPETVLLSERRDAALLLTLSRPQSRNALNWELVAALTEALKSAPADPQVRAVVLTGAGDAFCAGADLATLKAMRETGPAANAADSRRLKELYLAMLTCPLPVVAAVNGPALAGGCGLATACDLVIATPAATFGYPEVKVGFVASMVSVLLARQLGERVARTMLLSGRAYTAEEAVRLGLADRVVPAASLMDEVLSEVGRFSSGAPGALALTKELLAHVAGLPLAEALETAAMVNVFARQGEEVRRGIDAFLDRHGNRGGDR